MTVTAPSDLELRTFCVGHPAIMVRNRRIISLLNRWLCKNPRLVVCYLWESTIEPFHLNRWDGMIGASNERGKEQWKIHWEKELQGCGGKRD